ncbi:MAG: DUF3109 family protein [Bacteroidales bacterium]|jgi:hypothetical protein|nr:DUF3109 family protein [Bacteroidales bacterium]
MMQIGNCIVSTELLEEKFVCDLQKCKGHCCVEGESGAPLEEGEDRQIEENYPGFKPFLRPESVEALERNGFSVIDRDGELVTPLLNGQECVYAIFEEGIAGCGIEKAFFAGKSKFRKPISCHLYPVRIKKLFDEMDGLNYHFWNVCDPARELGDQKNVFTFEFLEDALVRKYGREWYNELKEAAEAYKKELDDRGERNSL